MPWHNGDSGPSSTTGPDGDNLEIRGISPNERDRTMPVSTDEMRTDGGGYATPPYNNFQTVSNRRIAAPETVGAPVPSTPPTPPPAPPAPYDDGSNDDIDYSSRESFIRTAGPKARQVAAETGLPADVLLAIPINENGGRGAPGNALYGIKGTNPVTGATTGPVNTWEDYGNGRVNTQDSFRGYRSGIDAMRGFAAFLKENPRCQPALDAFNRTGDPAVLVRGIHAAGYATDPAWSDKILSIANEVAGSAKYDTSGAATPRIPQPTHDATTRDSIAAGDVPADGAGSFQAQLDSSIQAWNDRNAQSSGIGGARPPMDFGLTNAMPQNLRTTVDRVQPRLDIMPPAFGPDAPQQSDNGEPSRHAGTWGPGPHPQPPDWSQGLDLLPPGAPEQLPPMGAQPSPEFTGGLGALAGGILGSPAGPAGVLAGAGAGYAAGSALPGLHMPSPNFDANGRATSHEPPPEPLLGLQLMALRKAALYGAHGLYPCSS